MSKVHGEAGVFDIRPYHRISDNLNSRPWPEERRQRFIARWMDPRVTYFDLTTEFGTTIYAWKQKLGLPSREPFRKEYRALHGGPNAPWKYQDEKLRELWERALRLDVCHTDICDEIGRSWSSIRCRAFFLDLPLLPRHCVVCGSIILDRPRMASFCLACLPFRAEFRMPNHESFETGSGRFSVEIERPHGEIVTPTAMKNVKFEC